MDKIKLNPSAGFRIALHVVEKNVYTFANIIATNATDRELRSDAQYNSIGYLKNIFSFILNSLQYFILFFCMYNIYFRISLPLFINISIYICVLCSVGKGFLNLFFIRHRSMYVCICMNLLIIIIIIIILFYFTNYFSL